VAEADAMIFGYVLLNDWSARDIQAWEYQPLGPFQAKATATTISPWIVTKAALEPFRTARRPRARCRCCPICKEPGPMLYDIDLSVAWPRGRPPTVIARTITARCTIPRPATGPSHHSAAARCGSATCWGPARSRGRPSPNAARCWNSAGAARSPITLDTGETRSFLEDGDTVTPRARPGRRLPHRLRPCTGTVLPALDDPDPFK
jgi:fumarylacetoacetase